MEALRVEGVTKEFDGIRALNDLSFNIKSGDRLAVIGPNGAGKTTLLNVLNGQQSPTAGRIWAFGIDITNMPIHRRTHLGITRGFQLTTLFMDLTVLENALLAIQGIKSSRFQMLKAIHSYNDLFSKAENLLLSWGLWGKKDEAVRTISYGDQRKLEIVLSLASDPKLLLLDEPSNGLTAAEGSDIATGIGKLSEDITVIIVAHDLDLVFNVAQHIIVMHYGQIISEGSCEEIQTDTKVREIYIGIDD